MNIGVYVTLLNDEFLVPYCFQALRARFPQTMVIDFGSTDKSCSKVPSKHLIHEGKQDPKSYIELKNHYSSKHDRVFWIDSDEIYPDSSLKEIEYWLHMKRERVVTAWRCVKINQEREIFIEKAFIRGVSVWNPATNYLAKEWPNEVIAHVDPDWQQPKSWRSLKAWCWHGVLLNRSSEVEPTSRYKKRLHRLGEAQQRNKWSKYNWLPWGDEEIDKYVPIARDIKSKKKRG